MPNIFLSKFSFKALVIVAMAAFGLGFLVSTFVYKLNKNGDDRIFQIRENSSDYQFINPLLFIDNSQVSFSEYDNLKDSVGLYITKTKDSKDAESVSFYFRDLNTGRWTGIDEDKLYAPSSMLKVITLITYLKLSESNPNILSEKIYYQPKDDPGQFYRPTKRLALGYHSVQELLKQMITYSDNDAMDALEQIRLSEILHMYKELQIPSPLAATNDFMSARDYSRVFRILYNSSYLSRPVSEQVLGLLTQTKFNIGLTAKIDPKITVAHKFGEHSLEEGGKIVERELHDCGIIYHPKQPYLLCVMTKGQDFSKLEMVISDISKIVFDEVENKSKI